MAPVPSCHHLARLCLPYDRKTQSEIVTHHDDWGKPVCKNCGWQTAVVRFLKLGLCLCETCFLNPKSSPPFWHLLDESNYNSANFLDFDSSYSSCSSSLVDSNCPFPNGSLSVINEDSSSSFGYTKNSYDSAYSFLDFDSSSSSYSPSFVDRNCPFPNGSLSVINEDSSSSFENFQIDEAYTKNNYGDEQVPMLRPDHLDIPKDIFDGDEAVLIDLKEYNHDGDLILPDQLIDEITNHSTETTSTKIISSSSSGMSSVTHKDYNIEALGNAGSQDFNINQMIGSKAKEETNNRAIFPNALVQLDCGQSQLILAREMLPWENQLTYVHVKRYTPQERKEALKRYFAKKKRRKFVRHIRYESRKSTADTKRRMKGRFIKAGAEYDYDPRPNNIKKGTHKKS